MVMPGLAAKQTPARGYILDAIRFVQGSVGGAATEFFL
jgi:hypothetical protein